MKHPRNHEKPVNELAILNDHLDDTDFPENVPLTKRGAYIDPTVFAEPYTQYMDIDIIGIGLNILPPSQPASDVTNAGFPFEDEDEEGETPATEEPFLYIFGENNHGRQLPARRGRHDEPACAREAPRFIVPDSVIAARKADAAAKRRATRAGEPLHWHYRY